MRLIILNYYLIVVYTMPLLRTRRPRAKKYTSKREYQPRANLAPAVQAPSSKPNGSKWYHKIPSGTFSKLAGTAGGFLGGPLGATVGSGLGNLASTILGFGDYSVRKNSILSASATGVPFMHSSDNSIRIKHKEFITDITATTAFSNQQFDVNPGLSGTFPFLSSIARSFTTYSIEGMVFYYKSTSADALNSTNTALGTVILASQYDVNEAQYTTKQEMEGSSFGNSAPPSKDQIHPIECDTSQNRASIFYVRSGDVPASGVKSNFDLCNFQIASSGVQATSVVAELWVSYDVCLYKPQITVPKGLNIPSSLLNLANVTNSAMLGTSMVETWNSLGVTVNHATGTVITIPANNHGTYICEISWTGDSTSSVQIGLTLANATTIPIYQGNSSGVLQTSGTVTNFVITNCFKLTDPNVLATLTYDSATLPANVTSATILISSFNGNIPSLV